MDDLISRQDAINELVRWGKMPDYNDGEKNVIGCVIGMLSALPSAQPERKKGKWFNYQGNTKIVLCSECRMPALESMTGCLTNQHLAPNRTNFCPNCGTAMEGEKSDETN